jgi:hypothetical protein
MDPALLIRAGSNQMILDGGIPLPAEERRARPRFQFRLPMIVRWATGETLGEVSAETKDISSDGIYFFLSEEIVRGTLVEITLTLPRQISLAGPVDVRCLGFIVRTESKQRKRVGLAAQVICYEFLLKGKSGA